MKKAKKTLNTVLIAVFGIVLLVLCGVILWGRLYMPIDSNKACYVEGEPVENELECKINTNTINQNTASTQTIMASIFGVSGCAALLAAFVYANSDKKK